ncbi:MAG: mannose-1-phosphate guanylyltransferase/mannose-6-phosphate isomerase [Chloroflexi bacterium]|nr:mannose-1-phosphate guanylyltransferase/mannose-6-phosphate isomerase [Chloroflexota bacterium]
MPVQPVILAGGSGSRLWPLSRENFPKPFLSLTGDRSLFQETILRLEGVDDVSPPIVVCNEEHRFLVLEQTKEIGYPPPSIILEPVSRNTAPALTLAALELANDGGEREDPIMLVLPADHVLKDVPAFQAAVRMGVRLAAEGSLVTFGVVPDSPKTGYGYIRKGLPLDSDAGDAGPFLVSAFVEKPDAGDAKDMVGSGRYLWNGGIFLLKASVWLHLIETYRPDIAAACREAHGQSRRDGSFLRPGEDEFARCPADSIDYAVVENVAADGQSSGSGQCAVIPLDAGWSDVGAWSALWEDGRRNAEGNVLVGDVRAESTKNSLLIGNHRLLAAVGLDNMIVVETADAVLVASKDSVQEVKELVMGLKADARPEQENHRKVHRPWGSYEIVDRGPGFQVKRLTVNPGAALSLQMHNQRVEHWVVVNGTAKVTRGDEEFLLAENESTYVPVGVRHRLENPGDDRLEMIEVQSGEYLGEDDIVRFEDHYDRPTDDEAP